MLKIYKITGSLPPVVEPDSLYVVKDGGNFRLYITDKTGSVAYSRIPGQHNHVFTELADTQSYEGNGGSLVVVSGSELVFASEIGGQNGVIETGETEAPVYGSTVTINFSESHQGLDYLVEIYGALNTTPPITFKFDIGQYLVTSKSSDQMILTLNRDISATGISLCGRAGSELGTVTSFEDTSNTHAVRSPASVRYSLASYSIETSVFTTCGYRGYSYVGTTQRFDSIVDAHTSRANATARLDLAGYSIGNYGFSTCGRTGSRLGTTQRFDDTANTHTSRADATARDRLAGYSLGGYGFSTCGASDVINGITQRFDDTANIHTSRANATARYLLAGYSIGSYGFSTCGNTGSASVGTTQRFDDTANTHTSRADATARRSLAGYSIGVYGFSTCGYTGSYVGTTQRFDDTANTHTSRADATARFDLAGSSIKMLGSIRYITYQI